MTLAPAGRGISDQAADREFALLAKALGHPARVQILRLLLAHDACFYGELAEALPLAQATVSQHVKVLREAGLVDGEVEPPRTCYHANRERLTELEELVGALLADEREPTGDRGDGCR